MKGYQKNVNDIPNWCYCLTYDALQTSNANSIIDSDGIVKKLDTMEEISIKSVTHSLWAMRECLE